MEKGTALCVTCAWRQACNKKFSMDGTTTRRCPEYTRDLALPVSDHERQDEKKPDP